MSFAQLLDVLAEESGLQQSLHRELLAAFRAYDREARGWVTAAELKRLLTSMGEKLTPHEGTPPLPLTKLIY